MRVKQDGTPTESEIGKALTKYYRTRWPKLALHFMHIPNGAHLAGNKKQRAIHMNRLKTEGLLPGVSDYFISLPTEEYCGLWLEIKSSGKEPTEEQLEFLDAQYSAGYATEWADNIDDCMSIVDWYMDMV